MTVINERVGAALDGMRLDRAVALVADVSRAVAARLLREGKVRLDDAVVASGARRVTLGESLALDFEPPAKARPTPEPDVVFDVVFEDSDVIVVNKPPELVVHPGAGHDRDTLVNGLLSRYPGISTVGDPERPGIVHRLDRGTSGLLVVARSDLAYQSLVEQMRSRRVERVYSCLVWGHLDASSGTIDAPVGRSRRNPLRMTVTDRGRPARTHYEVERRFDRPAAASLLACRLETGRTHQIRVHLKAIGHPVVGDRAYGAGASGTVAAGASLTCPRPFLHAMSLAFSHPSSGETVRAAAPLPDDLSAVLASLT